MNVRPATIDDLDWVLEQAKEFSKFYGTKKSLIDDSYARTGLAGVIENGVMLIAEGKEHRMGFIAGLIVDHPYNPKIRLLYEMLWWVSEPFRKTKAGYALLKRFIEIGKEEADWVTLCSLNVSPIGDRILERFGFKMIERNYLLEV